MMQRVKHFLHTPAHPLHVWYMIIHLAGGPWADRLSEALLWAGTVDFMEWPPACPQQAFSTIVLHASLVLGWPRGFGCLWLLSSELAGRDRLAMGKSLE